MRYAVGVPLFCALMAIASLAQTFTTLVNFDGSNGNTPYLMALIQGTDGNFYGTTENGGATGHGVVFQMTPSGTVTVLYSFTAGNDGGYPAAGLVQGTDGNFYGTTRTGGAHCCGTVFKVTPQGTLTTLYSFGGSDGGVVYAPLFLASDGNFYGVTSKDGPYGGGTAFKITPSGTLTTIYDFCSQNHGLNCTDGTEPLGGLVQATDGNFYGTTQGGGDYGFGTVYQLTPSGTLTVLHSFDDADDGEGPHDKLVQATDGNFYGTTYLGGPGSNGTVFKMTPGGALTTLLSFCLNLDCSAGAQPESGLIQAADGNFYGTATAGAHGHGTVYRMTPDGTATALHSFCPNGNCSDGSGPLGGLLQASDGTFYGTTESGGSHGDGTVFSLSLPQPTYTLTVSITGSGTVTSADGYINCPGACSHSYLGNTPVTLTAAPAQGWVFSSWTGCDQTSGNVCTLKMNNNRNVTAKFTMGATLSVTVVGNGTVTSSDGHINCGPTCSYLYKPGDQVVLTATPAQNWFFDSWAGCDSTLGNVCTVTMNSARTVTATFVQGTLLSVSVVGNGIVVSGGINCGTQCSSYYRPGTQVKLSAIPSMGSTLSAWTGCDTMQGDYCTVNMSGNRNVTATFAAVQVTLSSLSFTPASLTGGQMSIATLALGAAAPSGGVGVAISSDHPRVVHPPALVVVPGGATSVRFEVRTSPVRQKTVAKMTASANTSQTSATLTVNPR